MLFATTIISILHLFTVFVPFSLSISSVSCTQSFLSMVRMASMWRRGSKFTILNLGITFEIKIMKLRVTEFPPVCFSATPST